MNKGSAFIPEGLLPNRSDGKTAYKREYERLRKQFDPVYREHTKKQQCATQKRKYATDPDFRARSLERSRIRREAKNDKG